MVAVEAPPERTPGGAQTAESSSSSSLVDVIDKGLDLLADFAPADGAVVVVQRVLVVGEEVRIDPCEKFFGVGVVDLDGDAVLTSQLASHDLVGLHRQMRVLVQHARHRSTSERQ